MLVFDTLVAHVHRCYPANATAHPDVAGIKVKKGTMITL
jgi:hypothetical protein